MIIKDTHIVCWNSMIPNEVLDKIVQFAKECNIPEEYDRACDLVYTMSEDGKIVAVIALKRVLFSDGRTIPRWEHIFVAPHIRRSKKGLYFLLTVEQRILEDGFNQIWAYVNKNMDSIYEHLTKFGFKEYDNDQSGNYLIKNITKRRV